MGKLKETVLGRCPRQQTAFTRVLGFLHSASDFDEAFFKEFDEIGCH